VTLKGQDLFRDSRSGRAEVGSGTAGVEVGRMTVGGADGEGSADVATPAAEPRKKESPEQFRRDLRRLSGVIVIAGAAAALLYVVQFDVEEAFAVLGAAGGVAAAAVAVGGLLGFLFGIPKTLQSDRVGEEETRYLANTNLEQISDWLTKILVGIGLVQIAQAPEALASLADSLGPMFGDTDTSAAFGLSLAIYFAVSGFIVVYLWTRALLRGVLKAADQDIGARIEAVLSRREDANAEALVLATRQLTGNAPPTQEDLNRAMAAATPDYLVQIYGRAEEQRQRSWRDDKDTMVRTIPVFRALTEADQEHRYFRHFASLGFALKDQPQPDYEGAEKALTTAIVIRGRSKTLLIYEWNRALCRIHLDPAFALGQPAAEPQRAGIEADLRTAAKQFSERYFSAHPDDADTTTISEWLALNDLTYADLSAKPATRSGGTP
jgi:hypothetical protein